MKTPLTDILAPRARPSHPQNRVYAIYPDGRRYQINVRTAAGYQYDSDKHATPLSYAIERARECGASIEKVKQ